ncbi:elongation factor G [Desulfovibrionales bacterium]
MAKTLDTQRTYALVGTGGCGKTSLSEMLLFQSKAINRMGKVEEGTTVLDYEPEEIKRHGSVQPGFAAYTWKGGQHFLIDIPGDNNFNGDIAYLLVGVDAVIFTLDALDGVRPLTHKLWEEVRKADLPALICINKMDRDRANFDMVFAGLEQLSGVKPALLYLPIGKHDHFTGLVDILEGTALFFKADGKASPGCIPAELTDQVRVLREATLENIAESDEEFMEKYLKSGSLTVAEMRQGLKYGVIAGTVVPVVPTAALENKGGMQLLDAVSEFFPGPLSRAPWKGENDVELPVSGNGPATCFVIKTMADLFAGQLSIFRVLSGELISDSVIQNLTRGEIERVGQLLLLTGKIQIQSKEPFGPGSLVAVAKLKDTCTADILGPAKSVFKLKRPKLPVNLITYALFPREKGDEDKVYQVVQRILDEDVNLMLFRDEESSNILLSGMGQLHIETAVEKIRRRYKVDIVLKAPKIPYRETIKGNAEVQGRYKKQTGGRGQFGDCWVRFEPQLRGTGYKYVDAIVGGVIPRQYIPAVDKGIQESSARGFLAGYPMVDFKATCYYGSYHTVDSSEIAFKIAGSLAFKKAMEFCKPILLEPIVLLVVTVPDESMGDVIGDLSSRRGKVLGADSSGCVTEIKAYVPMNEVLRYAPDLRSMTGGQGTFIMEFDHYEEAPPHVATKVIAENRKGEE